MFQLNQQMLQFDQPFVIGEGESAVTYPPNWLRIATPEERAAIGIVEIIPESPPDDRFYFVTDNGDGTYAKVERPVDQVKAALVAQVKMTARTLLAQTSWYIERLIDPTSNEPVPQNILDERDAVRVRANELEAQINGCSSVAILATVQITWPSAENVAPV